MTLAAFITAQRAAAKKPTADIRSRWASRILARGLHTQGRAGAETYLRDYGRGISTSKVVALALMAEEAWCHDIAAGFWAAAYTLETGLKVDPPEVVSDRRVRDAPLRLVPTHQLPGHLRPLAIITQQPVDAAHDREHYIQHPGYIGQAKRDGNRLVITATADEVWYQARSTNQQPSPGTAFDRAFKEVARQRGGPFIIDGERVFLDAAGGEHRTGAQAAQANADLKQGRSPVICRISVFKALYDRGEDLTTATETTRIRIGEQIAGLLIAALQEADDPTCQVEMVPTAWTEDEKRALAARQEADGREGEVWLLANGRYLGGKSNDDRVVRTKYLTETEVVILGLTESTVKGRPFGAITVGERQPDGSLTMVGNVGTGFSQADARQILEARQHHPEGLRILVRHQGRTELGMLWHARFVEILGPVTTTTAAVA